MYQLYEVIPGPHGEIGEGGRTAFDSGFYAQWHESISDARDEARRLSGVLETARATGGFPGYRATEPTEVIVVRRLYRSLVDVAARRDFDSQRVFAALASADEVTA